ncbi:MAG: rubredoxin [Eggerthellaceae bacterium]|nr:rubredoxin [Eggerthellaceae bacterium]
MNEKAKSWKCTLCGYVLEEAKIPKNFVCPVCGAGPDAFEKVE